MSYLVDKALPGAFLGQFHSCSIRVKQPELKSKCTDWPDNLTSDTDKSNVIVLVRVEICYTVCISK